MTLKQINLGIVLAFSLVCYGFRAHSFTITAESNNPNQEIVAVLKKAVEEKKVPGIVAIVATSNDVLFQQTYGVRDLDSNAPMTADTVMQIASMTKAITSVGVMQLVEKGMIDLDKPIELYLPRINNAKILKGFDQKGKPILSAPKGYVTPRQLLSHTSGYVYEIWNKNAAKNVEVGGAHSLFMGDDKFIESPLAFEPGTKWEYGISTDILGVLIEAVSGQTLDDYFKDHIFTPLGMKNTWFRVPDEALERRATVYQRQEIRDLLPLPLERYEGDFFYGGGGLSSTGPDYMRFLQALLRGGELEGNRILEKETLNKMAKNQIGDLVAGGPAYTAMPELSNDFDFFPSSDDKFGLGFLLNSKPVEGGRAAGSLAWAGLFNTYYWIDRKNDITALIMVQVLPFFDKAVIDLLNEFELAVYKTYLR